jgi:CelD/BcsL family acetyltransferase involved in cellulose biosynthesis
MTAIATAPTRAEVHDLAAVMGDRSLRADWDDLVARCPSATWFSTAAWAGAWWATVAHRPATRVAYWRDDAGCVRAVAAVSQMRAPLDRRLPVAVPVARVTGSGPGDGDHCGPVVDPTRPDLVAPVAQWLTTASGARPLLGTGLAPPGARTVERVVCPRLDLAAVTGGNARVGRSSNFRSQLGRFERRLERAGVTFEWRGPGTVDAATVDALFDLHRRLRDEREQSTSLDDGYRALLHTCAAAGRADVGPAALVGSKGDEVVAVLLGFRCHGWFGAYQSGWDTTYAPHSIGSVLVGRSIREVATAGGHTFDFLRGAEDYKYRFGAVDAYDDVYLLPRGLRGSLLALIAAAKRSPRRAASRDKSKSRSTRTRA